LTKRIKKSGGRNFQGKITSYHIGGGARKMYRMINFSHTQRYEVLRLEYDPNRTAFIALCVGDDGKKDYLLANSSMKVGDIVDGSKGVEVGSGATMPLKNIPAGSLIYALESIPGNGASIVRAAGTHARLVGKDDDRYCLVELPSGETRLFNSNCRASIGSLSNSDHENRRLGKAGDNRNKGVRPTVRGVAMNPIDHPHGGGEGRTSGGRHPVTPWGVPTKGYITRKIKKYSSRLIIKRRR
jgi:large subunit ribosomal protein L2